jgi:hypothetical protein
MPEKVSYLDFIRSAAFYTGELRAGEELAERLGVFAQRGLPVTAEDLASDEFIDMYHSIKQSYE